MFSDLPFLEFNHRPTEYDDMKNYIKPHERAWSLEQHPKSKPDNEERLIARISEEVKDFDKNFEMIKREVEGFVIKQFPSIKESFCLLD